MQLYKNQRHAWKKLYTMSGLVLLSLSFGVAHEQIVQADADNNNQNPNATQTVTINPVSSATKDETLNHPVPNNNSTDKQQQSQDNAVINKQPVTNNQQQNDSNQQTIKESTTTLNINNNQPTNDNNNATIYSVNLTAKSTLGTDIFNIGDGNYPRVDAVDVSSWQSWMTQGDFNRLKQLGVKTVIVKLTDGTGYVNPAAQQQIRFAQNAGLTVAAYHFAEFENQNDARNEANHFADIMQKYGLGGNTAVVADMESAPVKYNNAVNDLNVFWNTLSQRGFNRHIVYTSINLDNQYHYSNSVGKNHTWIAQYPYSPNANTLQHQDYGAWQFSPSARLSGNNYLDVSTIYNSDIFGSSKVERLINGKWTLWQDNVQLYGFQKLNDDRLVYYDNNGYMVHGDQEINGHFYLINNGTGAIQTGWFENQANKQEHYVYGNGQYASGEEYIDGHWYYFDPDNNDAMTTNFKTLPDGRRVYYNEVGHMQYGEQFINGQWYHFDEHNGSMSTGFTTLNGNRLVYYGKNGQMVHHDAIINGNLYLINSGTGDVQTGWFKDQRNGQEHYVYSDGKYGSGEEYIANNWYYFNPENNNSMVSSQIFTLPDGRIVYYGQDGHMQYGEKFINGSWYNFNQGDGHASVGLTQLPDGRTVLYSEAGQMVYGLQNYHGHIYKLKKGDGRMLTGWQYDAEKQKLQYFKQNGQAATGNQKIGNVDLNFDMNGYLSGLTAGEHYLGENGNWCFVDSDGHVKVGFQQLGNRTVYYEPSTAMMVHGEKYIGGYWYFFDNGTGARATNVFEKLSDGRTTFYDQNGHMVYGEQYLNNNWYHFDEQTGAMTRGFYSFPNFGKSVYYDNNGHMVHGNYTINGTTYHFDQNSGQITGFNQRVVDWFRSRKGKLTYSMYGSRNGADGTADCSGSMTQAIRDAGGIPYSNLYNTENLHGYLTNNGYHLVGEGTSRLNVQYGDVIIWGQRGYSAGAGGHTLVISSFGDNPESISTSFWTNGQHGTAVSELPYYQYWADDDYPYQYVYRQWNQGRN